MQGITMDELYELIFHCHEAEFEYNGTTYVLQPEVNDNKSYLVIWDCTPDVAKCIAKHEMVLKVISRRLLSTLFFQKNVLMANLF